MPKTVKAGKLKKWLDSGSPLVLVDVLSSDSFNKCHIPGSINVPIEDFEMVAEKKLGKSDQIVVYCASTKCKISEQAYAKLESLGYGNIFDFEGGLQEWQEHSFPLNGEFNPEASRVAGKKAA